MTSDTKKTIYTTSTLLHAITGACLAVGVLVFLLYGRVFISPQGALAAAAAGVQQPFGGQIIDINSGASYCLNGVGMILKPAGSSPTRVIWTPAAITYREGPPMHQGQWVLGLLTPNFFCVKSWWPYSAVPMPLIFIVGTSK